MKTYRFVTETHRHVLAESLEEAIQAFNEMNPEAISNQANRVTRIEVQDEDGEFWPVDRPLRAGDVDAMGDAMRFFA